MRNAMFNKALYNVTSLTVKSYDGYGGFERSKSVVERFFQAASILSDGDCLGLAISLNEKGNYTATVFSGQDNGIKSEDYQWIFQGCANVNTEEASLPDSLPADSSSENGVVYALCIPASEEGDNYRGPSGETENYEQLISMMIEVGGTIWILAEPNNGNSCGGGTILFRLPRMLSVRLRAVLSMTFPGAFVKAVDEITGDEEVMETCWAKKAFSEFLYALMRRLEEKESPELEEAYEESLSRDEFCI